MQAKRLGFKLLSVMAISSGIMSGCSGSDPIEPIVTVDPPTLNASQAFEGSLVKAGQAQASQYIRNGIYTDTLAQPVPQSDAEAAPSFSDGQTGSFSQTNTQEVGVDEADRIEFDGSTFYVADVPIWLEENEGYQAAVRVLSRLPDDSLSEVQRLPIERPEWGINGMYLSSTAQSRLAVLSGAQPVYPVDAFTSVAVATSLEAPEFIVEIYDVNNVSAIPSPDKLVFDGRLLSSRRIDNNLYTISAHVPRVEGLVYGASDEATQRQNYQTILDSQDADLLPNVRLNEQPLSPLSMSDCLIPEAATPLDGSAQIIHVTKIDMNNPAAIESLCIVAVMGFTYMSQDALYMAGQVDGNTFIHKVSLEQTPTYESSGSVPGIVGWTSNPQLRLSEYEGVLRIVTTDYQTDLDNPLHRLFTLESSGNDLVKLGELPNEIYPDPIGKPGEDIYAVRYVGSKGYVVTFERIDPLYVIDLSDPSLPSLVGELEIPGFSSYLQPVGEDFLLGIGQQVDPAALPPNGFIAIEPISLNDMKVSLFDVRDPANPLELSTIIKSDTYSPVEWDYRTLSVLSDTQSSRFAMPIERWSVDPEQPYTVLNSLLIIDLDTSVTNPQLTEHMTLTVEEQDAYYVYAGEDRSVLTNTGVYYLRGNNLWFQANSPIAEPIGPF